METQQHPQDDTSTAPAEVSIFDHVDTSRYERHLKNARIWLYFIAAMQTIMGIVEYNRIDDEEWAAMAALIDVGVAFLFFIMALWSRSQPFAAFTTALVLYVVINVSSMALNPSGVSGFFLLKILVVIALVRAITSAREITKLKESVGE